MCAAQPPCHRVRGAVDGSKVGTKQKGRLRDDLRLEAARGNDGDLLEPGPRRRSGARVDEVMQLAPTPAAGTACRGALVAQQQGRTAETNRPSVSHRPRSPGAQVAAEIDDEVGSQR